MPLKEVAGLIYETLAAYFNVCCDVLELGLRVGVGRAGVVNKVRIILLFDLWYCRLRYFSWKEGKGLGLRS